MFSLSIAAYSCKQFPELGRCFVASFCVVTCVKSSYEVSLERFIGLIFSFVDCAAGPSLSGELEMKTETGIAGEDSVEYVDADC
jgi:hypothetical protein